MCAPLCSLDSRTCPVGCEAAQAWVSRRSLIPAPCTVRRHRAPIDPRNSMAQGQVKTSGFTYKETYDLFNQQPSLLNVLYRLGI